MSSALFWEHFLFWWIGSSSSFVWLRGSKCLFHSAFSQDSNCNCNCNECFFVPYLINHFVGLCDVLGKGKLKALSICHCVVGLDKRMTTTSLCSDKVLVRLFASLLVFSCHMHLPSILSDVLNWASRAISDGLNSPGSFLNLEMQWNFGLPGKLVWCSESLYRCNKFMEKRLKCALYGCITNPCFY